MKKTLLSVSILMLLGTSNMMAKTAATISGIEITVKEANNALKLLTKDSNKTWEGLPKDGKVQLINMIAPSKLVLVAAKTELSAQEKEAALSTFWMQKSMSKMNISDEEAKVAYQKLEKAAKAAKSKKKIPTFEQAKRSLKIQLAQEKTVKNLMKKATIKVK